MFEEIVVSIFLLAFTVSTYYYLRLSFSFYSSVVALISVTVPAMSHFWHLTFGEAYIASYCNIDENKVFGWIDCVDEAGFYNTYFNSYELTVPVEVTVLNVLGIELFLRLFNSANSSRVKDHYMWLVFLLLVGLLIGLPLPFFTYAQLKSYTLTYNVCGLVIHAVSTFFLFDVVSIV